MTKPREKCLQDFYKKHGGMKAYDAKARATPRGRAVRMVKSAKERAKAQGAPFALDTAFVQAKIEAGVCEVTGIPLTLDPPGEFRVHPYAPSLDRVIPLRGYTRDNVRLVCAAYNIARNEWGDDVLFRVAKALVSKQ